MPKWYNIKRLSNKQPVQYSAINFQTEIPNGVYIYIKSLRV